MAEELAFLSRARAWDAFYTESRVAEFRRSVYLEAFGEEYPLFVINSISALRFSTAVVFGRPDSSPPGRAVSISVLGSSIGVATVSASSTTAPSLRRSHFATEEEGTR